MNLDKLEIRKSKIRGAGCGCFALTTIPIGTIMGPYYGRKMTAKERKRVRNGLYIWKIHDDLFVDAKKHKKNNPLCYVNGAKTTCQTKKINCEVKFMGNNPYEMDVYYVATKDILPNEELIISYGDSYFI